MTLIIDWSKLVPRVWSIPFIILVDVVKTFADWVNDIAACLLFAVYVQSVDRVASNRFWSCKTQHQNE